MAVTASLVINFGDLDEKNILLEAEINENDNGGKTSFVAGDDVKFRIYHTGNYTVDQTAGSCSKDSTGVIQNVLDWNDNKLEQVSFAFSGVASTDKLIHRFKSGSWIGRTLGTIKKSGFNEVSGGSATSIGVAEIDYDTIYDLWTFNSPATVNGSTTYTVVIGITATE